MTQRHGRTELREREHDGGRDPGQDRCRLVQPRNGPEFPDGGGQRRHRGPATLPPRPVRRRLGRALVAGRVRRARHVARRRGDGARHPGRVAEARPLSLSRRHRPDRAEPARAWHGGAEAPLAAPDRRRLGDLVPDVLRALRRLGPRQRRDQGPPRRRWLAADRAEGLDEPGRVRDVGALAGADGPGRAQAQGPDGVRHPDGHARGHGPAAAADER